MEFLRNLLLVLLGLVILVGFLGWLGLQVQPQSFPAYPAVTPPLETVPLPEGLPAPVARYYRTVYGETIPVIETVVIQGRAVVRPFMNIPFPARFVFVHNAGKDYRHYMEATWFGIPLMKVNEGYLDGASFFESPMGSYTDEPNANQGANLALWAEAGWFPSIWLTDPRARWAAVDEQTALLTVPYEEDEETFVVRFDPQSGLIDSLEAMRYREVGEDKPKILWITQNDLNTFVPGTQLSTVGSATWLDQGKPWATFRLEELIYNVDVSEYIRQRGR